MAVFLGKPAILVEHHGFFKDRLQALKGFVQQLEATCPTVRWSGLGDLAVRTFQMRRAASGTFEVRLFTDQIVVENPESESQVFQFQRRIPPDAVVESVIVNGAPVSHTREGEFIGFQSQLDGNSTALIRVQRGVVQGQRADSRGWTYGARVATRRLLSEVRDNWLSRSETVLKWANRIMKALHMRRSS
jgi:hypothetical protein